MKNSNFAALCILTCSLVLGAALAPSAARAQAKALVVVAVGSLILLWLNGVWHRATTWSRRKRVLESVFALAQGGDFPALLGAIHPRWRTPYVSIAVFAVLVWAFAQFAGFSWNVTLSAVARVLFYVGICAAVPVLRRKQPGAAAFRVPGGLTLPVLGIAICALLLTRVDFGETLILLATIAVALLNWVLVRGRTLGSARA